MTNRRNFIGQATVLVAGGVVGGSILSNCSNDNSKAATVQHATPSLSKASNEHGMKLVVGSDHAGYALKARLLNSIKELGYEIIDMGCFDETPVDFPDIAQKVCTAILNGDARRGIMFCGTGVGAAIACNKIPGIRAAVCHDIYSAHQCVEHDDVQVIALGAQVVGHSVALEYIERFLSAEFSTDEAFRRRVEKLNMMDRR